MNEAARVDDGLDAVDGVTGHESYPARNRGSI